RRQGTLRLDLIRPHPHGEGPGQKESVMRRTAAAANRTGLIILGLIALIIGLAVLAIGFGLTAQVDPALEAGADLGPVASVLALPYSALIAVVVALILAIIGLRWLSVQVPRKDFAKPFRMQADAR